MELVRSLGSVTSVFVLDRWSAKIECMTIILVPGGVSTSTLGHERNSGAARVSTCDVQKSAGTTRQSHHAGSVVVSSGHPAIRCRKWLELRALKDLLRHEAVVLTPK